METIFDIAATASAILWPAVIIVFLVLYREKLPNLLKRITSRINSVEFAGISIELAKAKEYEHEWSMAPGALDLRHKATAIEVSDSTARTFISQLFEEATADYASVNLGQGREWLTSRLYIMSILFPQMKGIKCFVFFENDINAKRKYVGWVNAKHMRWMLSIKYPWLEAAFAEAYAVVMTGRDPKDPGYNGNPSVVVSETGRIAYPVNLKDIGASIDLLKAFLLRIQQIISPLPGQTSEWVNLDDQSITWEHAEWLTPEKTETIFGRNFTPTSVRISEVRGKSNDTKLKLFLETQSEYVAVVDDNNQLEYLVKRNILLHQMAQTVVDKPDDKD